MSKKISPHSDAVIFISRPTKHFDNVYPEAMGLFLWCIVVRPWNNKSACGQNSGFDESS